jgi:SseB protein C-terminal domain/SseB protein N-terminal domain
MRDRYGDEMPFPANPLEVALAGVRAGTTSADELLDALGANPLWVPLPSGVDAQGQAELPVMILDSRPHVAVYTSAEQYSRGAGGQAHMEMTGRQLADLMADELGLAVNPGAELGLPVNQDGVRVLRGGRKRVAAGTRVRLGDPAEEPHQLIAALAGAFASTPAVREARRAFAQIGDERPALLIGVRVDHGISGWQRDSLAAVTDAVAQAPVPYPVDTVFLDDDADPVNEWMLAHTDPFYSD